MKALVYHGPNSKAWEEKPKPTIKEPTDAIVRISKRLRFAAQTLHILKGDVPEVIDGRILGHEVGIIEEVGVL
jgi:alcohol dehydrogenase